MLPQIAREIEDVGGDINAYTSKELTAYYVKLLSENYLLGIDILSDILDRLTFPNSSIKKLKRRRYASYQLLGCNNFD